MEARVGIRRCASEPYQQRSSSVHEQFLEKDSERDDGERDFQCITNH